MSAQAITARIILRPHYDNTRLDNFGLWLCDNARMLARFATELGFDLSIPDADLSRWIHCQYDIEVLTSTADQGGDRADGSKTTVETVRASSRLSHGEGSL